MNFLAPVPRWLQLVGIALMILVLLVIVMMLSGGGHVPPRFAH
jgi:hypothetical protein